MAIIKAGTTLTLTTGCYSDYRDHGPFVALLDFDQVEAPLQYRADWAAENPEPNSWDEPDPHGFIGWLSLKGFIQDIDGARSWHLGAYELEPDVWPDADATTPAA